MRKAVIVSAVRSPVGKMRGGLSPLRAHELGAQVLKEAVLRAGVEPSEIDEVLFGTVMNKEMNNAARVIALEAGLPESVPAMALDRQCGTSLNAVAYAAILIQSGVHDVVATGGVDMDTRKPWILERVEQGFQAMPPRFIPPVVAPARYGRDVEMLMTAEKLAKQYAITREECDAYALESHRRALAAWEAERFASQLLPIEVDIGKGKTATIDRDETMRASTMESMAKLRIASGVQDGVVTAGNSSPNCDGASAVVVMERKKAEDSGCPILGVYGGYASVGVDPTVMGIGPVYAIRKLLKQVGMNIQDIDLFEINEAFASQTLACIKELGLNREKLNVNGGAIALGHPLAATGGILISKMLSELARQEKHWGVISFCVGGGQGVAMLIERI